MNLGKFPDSHHKNQRSVGFSGLLGNVNDVASQLPKLAETHTSIYKSRGSAAGADRCRPADSVEFQNFHHRNHQEPNGLGAVRALAWYTLAMVMVAVACALAAVAR